MKASKNELSRTFINERGELITEYNTTESIVLKIRKIFKILPFMVSFILCGLLFIEIFCVFGLIKTLLNPANLSDLGVYIFLSIAIAFICVICFGTAWYLTVEEERNKQAQTKTNRLHY